MSKLRLKSKIDLPYPQNLIQEYVDICQLLRRYEKALIKRFAPNLRETSDKFIRLAKRLMDDEIEPYSALCFQGAAKCERLYGCHQMEWDFWLQAAAAFERAYFKRIELGFEPDFQENLEGALRCYDEILRSPHLSDTSPIRAGVILALKKINPRTQETCSFTSPVFRYHDLEKAAKTFIEECDYHSALMNLTDIHEDIVERRVVHLYAHLLPRNEITRLLLLLILQPAPGSQRAANMALWNAYQFSPDLDVLDMLEKSHVSHELHMMLRELVQSIVHLYRPTLVQVFNDLGNSWWLDEDQHKLLKVVFEKYEIRCLFVCDCEEKTKSQELETQEASEGVENLAAEEETSIEELDVEGATGGNEKLVVEEKSCNEEN